MKVSIVIPYWNGAKLVAKHLPNILKIAKQERITEIIACDDASTDETVSLLKNKFPEVILVQRQKNGGFSSNVNSGVAQANGDLIFLLNSDAEPKPGFLKPAIVHFANSKVASVGCRVGEGLWTTAKFNGGFFWHGQGQLGHNIKPDAHQTLWVSGGSGIFRKVIWEELGGLDTLFDPFYEEDVDFGYRATKRGYLNIWEPESEVEHYQEKGVIEQNFSSSLVSQTAQRNQLIFIWKNITSSKLLNQHKQALLKMLTIHPKYWAVFLQAVKKWPQIMEKRAIEKKYAQLTDEEILAKFAQ
ncbi:MAG: glycosyltransferase family 2 protein [Patescibacteria group bacterium]|nr:glycosyltransferase family 2 protein [Patescibacteria group bacterium]